METVKTTTIEISSPAFSHGEDIPSEYTCDGANVNPPLHIEQVPEEARSLALIVDDPDAPSGVFAHWLMWNIPAGTRDIQENTAPGVQGLNGFMNNRYEGPCPPSGKHHYCFRIYALDKLLTLDTDSTRSEVLNALQGHIIASGELMGYYKR